MRSERQSLLVCATFLTMTIVASAGPVFPPPVFPPQTGNPSYTQDSTLTDFTDAVSSYGTFVSGSLNQSSNFYSIPYTPTTAILTASGFPRVIGNGEPNSNTVPFNPIVVQFSSAVSQIEVFPNLDHVATHTGNGDGSFGWDAYQYAIYGGTINPLNPTVVNFTLLFNPITVIGTDDPTGLTDPHFTLGTWYGTGPTLVNNSITLGTGFGGTLGYEAYFDFGSNAYPFYGFTTSSVSGANGVRGSEFEVELSAVAQATATPEPTTLVLVAFGISSLLYHRASRSYRMGRRPSDWL